MEKHTLKVEEVGQLLGISRASAYNLARSEGFPSIRVGKRLVIPTGAFSKWMDEKLKEKSS